MAHQLSYHVNKFSERIRIMNDTGSKDLTLSAADARSLHTDIFALLAKITELHEKVSSSNEITTIDVTGGRF